jgi:23S rRNA pseudouridine955/2504/2580 synthase
MTGVETITVADDEAEQRLDRWFKRRYPALGHGRLEKLLRTGQIRLDGKRAKAGDRVRAGQSVRVPPLRIEAPPPARPAAAAAASEDEVDNLLAAVLYRDRSVIVLNKPAGLPVQGGVKSERNVDAILAAAVARLGARALLVHRLDRDTSGALALALSPAAARALTAAFRDKRARKLYWAVVAGQLPRRHGVIDLPLMKRMGPAGERVVAVDLEEDETASDIGARRATTRFRVLDNAGPTASWVALEPMTGRTHQLRVHLAAIGAPILGDGKYGGTGAFLRMEGIARKVHLHARRLVIPHPERGVIDVKAPPSPDFLATLKALGLGSDGADELLDD